MNRILTVLLSALIVFSSCEKVDKLTQFTITDKSDMTVPAGAATLLPFDVSTPPVSSVAEQELTMNDSRLDMIESVLLEELKMVITTPSGRTFDFLKDIEIYISADGLPEQKVAYANAIADNVTNAIFLTTDKVELEQYLKKGTYRIRTRITTDKIVNEDIKIQISSRYRIDARILGV